MEDSRVQEFMQKEGRIDGQLQTKRGFISHCSNTVLLLPEVTLLCISRDKKLKSDQQQIVFDVLSDLLNTEEPT